jgi:carboxylesterase type B
VLNEASPEIFAISPTPLPDSYFEYIMTFFVGQTRAEDITECPQFQLNSSDPDTVRDTLSVVGTQFFWTCAVQMNAITYSNHANVYLYELQLGCTFPDNEDDPLCTESGQVCHEDDLPLVFGTCTNPTSQQSKMSREIIGRWTAFAANGNPNIAGATEWSKVEGSSNLNVLLMSPTDVVNQTLYADVCGPIFGGSVPFNFQIY